MKYKVLKTLKETERDLGVFCKSEKAVSHAMFDIMSEIGEGDCENAGRGSLWKCAGEIYDILKKGDKYYYADCSWWVVPVVEDRTYSFMCSVRVSKEVRIVSRECRSLVVAKLDAMSQFETELAAQLGEYEYRIDERNALSLMEA